MATKPSRTGTALAATHGLGIPQFCKESIMNKSTLLVALTAASLTSGVALAQTYGATKPESTKPQTQTTRPAMETDTPTMAQLDKNKDGAVDKLEARVSPKLAAIFDKADTNKDGKLDAAELSAASSMSKLK